jgi:hypothetical protein
MELIIRPAVRYGYRPLPGRIPKVEMDSLILQMSAEDTGLIERAYVLDRNCLDAAENRAPEYVLADHLGKLKATETKKVFAALRGAAEKRYGKLQDLPRFVPIA